MLTTRRAILAGLVVALALAPVCSHAFGWLAAGLLVLASAGLGMTLFRQGFTLGFVAGAHLLGTALLALSATHALAWGGWILGVACLPAIVVALKALPDERLPRTWLLLAAAVLALPYLAQTCMPDHDWDGVAYHLPTARMLLERGAWTTEPLLPQCNFPAGTHLFYAWLLAFDAEPAIIPLNMLASVLVVLAARALARDLFGARAAAWTTAIVATSNIVLELGFDPRIDHFMALWFLAACHAFFLWTKTPERRSLLLVCGQGLGLGLATKYTGAILVIALAPALLWTALRLRGLVALALCTLAAIVPAGFWYARNAIELADPVYPFFHGRVFERGDGKRESFVPAVEKLIAQLGMPPAEFAKQFPAPDATPKSMWNPIEYFLDPDAFETKTLHWLSPLLLFFVALLFRRRDRDAVLLTVVCLIGWAGFAAGFPATRYALPIFMLMAVGAGDVIARLPDRWRRALVWVTVALLARQSVFELRKLVSLPALEAVCPFVQWERHPTRDGWKWIDRLKPWRLWLGIESHNELLLRIGYNRAKVVPEAAKLIAERLAKGLMQRGDVLMMIGDDKAGLIPLRVLPDMSREGYRFLTELIRVNGDHGALAKSLAARGVRHVLVNGDYFRWCARFAPWGAHADLVSWRYFLFSLSHVQRFVKEQARLVHEWPGFAALYELNAR